jgi:hypothetical protein
VPERFSSSGDLVHSTGKWGKTQQLSGGVVWDVLPSQSRPSCMYATTQESIQVLQRDESDWTVDRRISGLDAAVRNRSLE